jgi:heme exporter protein C
MDNFYDFLKPKILMNISNRFLGLMIMISGILMMSSLYLGIYVTEADFQQGESFRIIYIHVTAAWITLGIYSLVAILSLIYLINKHTLIYLMAKTNVFIGINFSIITLTTGSLWGRPTWGSFWVWDARLTSVLILFFLYLGYLMVDGSHEIRMKGMNNSSILAIIGFINIPIIKYSVHWWNTLHQSSSVTQNYITLDQSIFIPLFLCFFAMIGYGVYLFLLEMRKHILMRKVESYYL